MLPKDLGREGGGERGWVSHIQDKGKVGDSGGSKNLSFSYSMWFEYFM